MHMLLALTNTVVQLVATGAWSPVEGRIMVPTGLAARKWCSSKAGNLCRFLRMIIWR